MLVKMGSMSSTQSTAKFPRLKKKACPTFWFTLRSHMFRPSSFNIFSTGGDSTYRSENDMPYVHICILYIQLWIMIFNLHIFCIWTSIFLHLFKFRTQEETTRSKSSNNRTTKAVFFAKGAAKCHDPSPCRIPTSQRKTGACLLHDPRRIHGTGTYIYLHL